MSFQRIARRRLTSFDGGISTVVDMGEPERYAYLESQAKGAGRIIARGGGYSYAAASFGEAGLTLSMKNFNRLLAFDPVGATVTVEPGITVGDLLAFTAPRGCYLPVLPGYPEITIGGCVGSNVHGKSASHHGTMVDWVNRIEVFHPAVGYRTASRTENSDLFHATCGGFGLTGVLTSIELRLAHLPGMRTRLYRQSVGSLDEGLEKIAETVATNEFAYTWHDGASSGRSFGKGFLFFGDFIPQEGREVYERPKYRPLPPVAHVGRLPVGLWGGIRTRAFNRFYRSVAGRLQDKTEESLFDSFFPLVKKDLYFRLYGRRGFQESQILLPRSTAPQFLLRLREVILAKKAPTTFVSLKMFRGEASLIRFAGDGVCVSFDMARSRDAKPFLDTVDDLMLEHGGIPYLAKDSRLSGRIVSRAYGERFDQFRKLIRNLDPGHRIGSELSERLGLWSL